MAGIVFSDRFPPIGTYLFVGITRKAPDHSAQGNASQMPKRIRDFTKVKATQHRIIGKPFFLEPAKRIPKVFS